MTEEQWLSCTDSAPRLEYLRDSDQVSGRKVRLFAVACVRGLGSLLADGESRQAVEVAERYADGLATEEERDAASEAATAVLSKATAEVEKSREATRQARRGSYPVEGKAKVQARAIWVREAATLREAQARQKGTEAAVALLRRLTGMERQWPERFGLPPEERLAEQVLLLRAAGAAERALLHAIEAAVVRENWECNGLTPSSWGGLEEQRGQLRRQLNAERCSAVRCLFGNPFRTPPAVEPTWLAWGGGTALHLARVIDKERAFDQHPILADALEEAGCNHAEVLSHLRGPGPHFRGCWVLDLLSTRS